MDTLCIYKHRHLASLTLKKSGWDNKNAVCQTPMEIDKVNGRDS